MTERERTILEVATQLAHAELSAATTATVFNLDTKEVVERAGALLGDVLDYCADDEHPLEALAAEAPAEEPGLRESLRQVGRALRRKFLA